MPVTPKEGKWLQRYRKELFTVQWANGFCDFFNDPIGFLKKFRPDNWSQIAKDQGAQDKFAETIRETGETLKQAIRTAEAFFESRNVHKHHSKEALQAFQKSCNAVKLLPSVYLKYDVEVDNDGDLVRTIGGYWREPLAEKLYHPASVDTADFIHTFKSFLFSEQDHLPVGVCRLETCRIFFVKKRKDERYCSRQHANTAAVRRKRAAEKRKRQAAKS
jgi:hypothetical protein